MLLKATINPYILVWLLLFASSSVFATDGDGFITTWQITTANEEITLPISNGRSGFNVSIDWGDGTMATTHTKANPTHTYTATGTYSVQVLGTFNRINFLNSSLATNSDKISAVTQWGTTRWNSMRGAFFRTPNLVIPSTAGNPDLRNVTDMEKMFERSGFNFNISGWNVSSVTDMEKMFERSGFNFDISGWNVSSVTNMMNMFNRSAFNSDISGWNVSAVENMSAMFDRSAFNSDISNWNVSSVTNMMNMFNDAAFNQNLGKWYIAPSTTSIMNLAGQTLTINAQNTVLNTGFAGHNTPTYVLSGTDADKFSLIDNILTLTIPTASVSSYEINITSTGGFSGPNQTTLTLSAFSLDIDDNGELEIATDGILIMRFMANQSSFNTADAVASDRRRNDEKILTYLSNNASLLDVDDNNNIDPFTDGILIMRFMADQSAIDTTGAVSNSRIRTDEEILDYLQSITH